MKTNADADANTDINATTKLAALTAEQQQLVVDNLGLVRVAVRIIADRYRQRGFPLASDALDDLACELRLTLCRCAIHFDPTHGTKFSTYAVRAMLHAGEKYLVGGKLIRLPSNATLAESPEWIRAAASRVLAAWRSLDWRDKGMDEPFGATIQDPGSSVVDTADVADGMATLRAALERCRRSFTGSSYAVLDLHLRRPELDRRQLAEACGVTHQWVHQVLLKGYEVLRQAARRGRKARERMVAG